MELEASTMFHIRTHIYELYKKSKLPYFLQCRRVYFENIFVCVVLFVFCFFFGYDVVPCRWLTVMNARSRNRVIYVRINAKTKHKTINQITKKQNFFSFCVLKIKRLKICIVSISAIFAPCVALPHTYSFYG